MTDVKLKPCPDCNGEIKIYLDFYRGAISECQKCGKEVDICGWDKIPLYHGMKVRKSTADKIRRMWNRQTESKGEGING